jgi:formamidopyrimidine-DNA glycosylase
MHLFLIFCESALSRRLLRTKNHASLQLISDKIQKMKVQVIWQFAKYIFFKTSKMEVVVIVHQNCSCVHIHTWTCFQGPDDC